MRHKFFVALLLSFFIPLAALAVSTSDPVYTSFTENPFPDTDLGEAEGLAAAELARREVIGGYPDGTFGGDNNVNRAEAAKFLILAKYGKGASLPFFTSRFPDVNESDWFMPYVLAAANGGVINGHPDGTFKPADTVNTAEFLKMITLTFGLEENLEYDYTDVSSSDWFARYAGVAQKYNIFPHRTSLLLPSQFLTRNEVAVAIYKALEEEYGKSDLIFCEDKPEVCPDTHMCIRAQCRKISDYLPDNLSDSEKYCENDEVYKDGKCEKAKMNMVFYSQGIEDDLFEQLVDSYIAGFIFTAGAEECKENVRYHKLYHLCLPEEDYWEDGQPLIHKFRQYFMDRYGAMGATVIHPYLYFEEGCFTSGHYSVKEGFEFELGGAIHELGHTLGLVDQYCYIPEGSDIPNPVDFEEAECRKPKDDWFKNYCSSFNNGEAYQCKGNKNSYGGRTAMSGKSTVYDATKFTYGFSDIEMDHLQKELGCK